MQNKLIFTTLCYIEQDGKYLMLHRNKKKDDINKNKYIGIGGHLEHGETPEECIVRETLEETGLKLENPVLRGMITFVMDEVTEHSFLYTCDAFSGSIHVCTEGELEWIEKDKVLEVPLWEGDKIFLPLLGTEERFFNLKLVYEKDVLKESKLTFNGE